MLSLAIPIQLLLILSGLLLSVIVSVMTWSVLVPSKDTLSLERFDTLLLGLLLVAAFAMGVFLTVVFAPTL